MKRNILILLVVVSILIIFSTLIFASSGINVKDYIKGKLSSSFIFGFYLSSLEDLDSYEKEFIDFLEKLPEEEQKYYAKEVYKNGFSLELLEEVKTGKKVPIPTSNPPTIPQEKPVGSSPSLINIPQEKPVESLPSLIKRIKPSTVIIFAYDDKGEFLQLGSGFFISQNGDIITNYHVIQGASSAEIKTADGKTYPIAYIVAEDEQSDIIRLSVDIPSQYVHPLSLSTKIPEVGERIIVYGSPLGLEKTVSDGIVSAIREIFDYGKLIQITAPISSGSSGSPVLNMQGEVIGIATFQFIEGQNLNFAIPSERIANLILSKEKETFTTEELFGQEEKEKTDSDYAYEALDKALYFTFIKEEYEKALPYWEIVIEIEPVAAYFSIGICYEKLGAYTKAVEAYKQVISLDPDGAGVHSNLGFAYSQLGFYKDAIEAFKQAIRINPDDAKAYCNMGVAYDMHSLDKDAIEAWKQAIYIDPDYIDAYFKLGVKCMKTKYYKDAIEAFKQIIRIDPDFIQAYFGLAYTYDMHSLDKDAIEAFKQIIRIDPNNVDAHYSLGLSYSIIGDKKSALNEYKILKELDIDLANKLFDLIY